MSTFVSVFIVMIMFLYPFTASIAKESSSSAETATNNYLLAYPGILPDHPLYILKKIRDKIIPLFITSPENKINYYLLQTDKGIHAASLLLDKGENALAKETALKAEHNFTLLTYEIKKDKTVVDSELFKKLEKAADKHQELLETMENKADKSDKKTFETVRYFSARNIEEIENTLHSPK